MIRFAICDDDKSMTGYLDTLIMSLNPLYNQDFDISVFFSGEDFCDYINNTGEIFDIVLMDIEMRGITGVETGRKLRENIANELTLLIFVSSHQNYYSEIVDLNVFCFIPKPIFLDEFNLKLNKAIKRVILQRQIFKTPDFIIKKSKQAIHIPINSIMYLESDIRMIHLYTESDEHIYYGVLDEEESKLPKSTFARIHKSYLISFDHIAVFTAKDVIMKNNRSLSISDKYRENVKTAYLRYRGKDE